MKSKYSLQNDLHKPEQLTITLEGMTSEGDTYAYYNDEKINVFGGIEGEEVVVEVIRYKRKGKSLTSAFVLQVLKPSRHRINAPCPYFGKCTGCQWQHIDYPFQLILKRETILRELQIYQSLQNVNVSDALPSPELFNYRNHARFTVRNGASLVFTNRLTRKFVRIDNCMIMAEGVNKILRKLQDKCGETRQLSIRYGIHTGQSLVQPKLHNPNITEETGQTHYRERLLGQTFRIGSPSFFQVNTKQAENLVNVIKSSLSLDKSDVLVDAYAGVGTFAVLLAKHVKKVTAIEESYSAIKDASINTENIRNLEYIHGKTEHVIDKIGIDSTCIILDPPRSGCHPKVLEALANSAIKRIAYVSCDPNSMARDLDKLVDHSYLIKKIIPVDMFPHTHHIEIIAILEYEQNN